VSRIGGKIGLTPTLTFNLCATGGVTSKIPSASTQNPPIPNVNGGRPANLSSYVVDPTAAYENKPGLKSTVGASARLVIDVLKESSDAFTPLKSVVGGLSAVLKNYDVRHTHPAKQLTPLILKLASDGKS
jgi:hypothetical protein